MRREELPGLTGIRFYAALTVFVTHIVEKIPGGELLPGANVFLGAGSVAVSFFFVLSGFILTYNYHDSFSETCSLSSCKRFVWDRLAKIFPVHMLMLLAVIPISVLSPNHPLDWRAFPFHLTLVQCWWPSASPRFFSYYNTPSWSISCELLFYVLTPVTIFAIWNKSHHRLLWALILVYGGGLGWVLAHSESAYEQLHFMNWFAPSRFLEFLAGIYLGKVFLCTRERTPQIVSIIMQGLGIALIVAGAILKHYALWPLKGGLLIIPGAALLVIGLAHGHGPFVSHLSRSILKRLGIASFSFYLIHDPIVRAMRGVWLYLGWDAHSWVQIVIVAVPLFLLAQAVAWVACYHFEIPVQRRLRSLIHSF